MPHCGSIVGESGCDGERQRFRVGQDHLLGMLPRSGNPQPRRRNASWSRNGPRISEWPRNGPSRLWAREKRTSRQGPRKPDPRKRVQNDLHQFLRGPFLRSFTPPETRERRLMWMWMRKRGIGWRGREGRGARFCWGKTALVNASAIGFGPSGSR